MTKVLLLHQMDRNVGAGTLNGNLGLRYWFNEKLGVEVQTMYKHAFEDYIPKHFQHSVGLVFKFGGTDTDNDGIYDQDDACPEEAGLEMFNGCPDSDNDGIQDSKDDCPNTPGLAEFNGCPDSMGGTLFVHYHVSTCIPGTIYRRFRERIGGFFSRFWKLLDHAKHDSASLGI